MTHAAPVSVVMPQLGLTMREGTLIRWLKRDGEPVAQGDALCLIETEKITHEIEATSAGYVQILTPEGATIPTGEVIGRILAARFEAMPAASHPSTNQLEPEPVSHAAATPLPAARGKREISPVALKLAKEHNLALDQIRGSGPRGRIHKADVLQALQQQMPGKPGQAAQPSEQRRANGALPVSAMEGDAVPYEVETITPMRRRIGEHMQESLRTTAQLTLMMEADVTDLVVLKEHLQAESQRSGAAYVTFTHLLIKGVALALRQHRRLNAALVQHELRLYSEVNIGVATALEDGLLVPVICHADQKSLGDISSELTLFTEQARHGTLHLDHLAGGTFTITNLGPLGVDYFTPILSRNQSGVLGIGRIVERQGSGASIQRTIGLSLTFDHRVVDGAPAAAFLGQVKSYLEHPWQLFLAASS